MRFPVDFPQSCPDNDAVQANGTYYRIVRGDSLSEADFMSYHELGKLPNATPCRRVGVSLYNSRKAALHMLSLQRFLGRAIAEGRLSPSSGKTKLTNPVSGHVCWWPFEDVVRHRLFSDPQP